MGSRIRLVYQGLALDLNDKVTYFVEVGFVPPAVQKAVNYAQGSIINQRGGKRISEKALDREWSFTVRIEGSSPQETHQATRQIQSFINLAADTKNKLYLEYWPSDAIPYKPTWGQQGYYYQIKAGKVESWDKYAAWSADHVIKCTVTLTIGPYAEGIRQRLGEVLGGILEDNLATADGSSRGPAVLEAITNIFTNPVFGNATYNNGWTMGADLYASRNTKKEFILFDRCSVQLVRTGATNIRYYQSLACGNTNPWTISFYCKKPDGSAVTASDVTVYYGSSQTTTFEGMGNGWYLCSAAVTGVAAATNTGVQLETTCGVVYVDGFQMEELAYPTRLAYGDLLGCAWTGTKHASTSTRAAGHFGVAGTEISPTQYILTYRAVVKFHHANTRAGDRYIFGTAGVSSYFRASDDKIVVIESGVTTIATAALTFAAGAVLVLHYTMNQGTVKIYVNGVEAASGTGFHGRGIPESVYLGSTSGKTTHGDCTFLDFTTWELSLTATQIANDYADISQRVTADAYGKNLSPIPWMWDKDGDWMYNHYYDATHQDWMVVGGIPGSGPAKSVLRIGAGPSSSAFVIGNHAADIPLSMPATFEDLSGTADAAALGGQVLRTSIDTTGGDFDNLGITYDHEIKRYGGRQAHIFLVVKDSRTDLMARPFARFSGGPSIGYGDYKTLATTATLKHFLIGPIIAPEFPVENDWTTEGTTLVYGFFMKHAGGTANVDVDYYRVLIGDICYILGAAIAGSELVIDSDWNVWEYVSAGSNLARQSLYQGNQFQLYPGMYNHLVMLHGLIGENDDLTKTIPITALYVTPIYDLL